MFNGTNPNGTWNLYIRDDAAIDTGSISGGASLIITTTTSVGDYTGAAGQLIFPAGTTTQTITIPVIGDVTPEANEVFQVNLSAAINGAIGDAQAVGTIVNDDGGGTLPTAANDGYVTPVSTALVIAAPGVLANDSANGGGALSAAGASGPSHGILSIASNGGFTYTPTAAYTGPDSFTYYALNTFGGSLATVSITVGAVAPTTVNDALSTTYPSALNLAAPGVLANDNANGGGALTAALVSNVTNGTLTLGANGSVSYTPNFGFAGSDSFTYRAVSAGGNGNVATVTIAVAPPTNVQAPVQLPRRLDRWQHRHAAMGRAADWAAGLDVHPRGWRGARPGARQHSHRQPGSDLHDRRTDRFLVYPHARAARVRHQCGLE